MFHITHWKLRRSLPRLTLSCLALSLLALTGASTSEAIAAGKTITAVMHSDLRVIDPGFTTAERRWCCSRPPMW